MDSGRVVTTFIYGLVFFVLGLATALQSRNYSRLELAKSLPWLALFGITHGLNEWGDLFIPIQASNLPPAIIELLQELQLIILALSFTFLLEFGITLLRPFHRTRWADGISAGVFILWMVITQAILTHIFPDFTTWRRSSNAFARYFIGFPGGMLAAVGLFKHARYRIAPFGEVRFLRTFKAASYVLGCYAVLTGLITPRTPFFPGSWLNNTSFTAWVGIQPYILRSIIGLILMILMIRGLEVFNLETQRLIETMERDRTRSAERERIAATLHDGAIQKVYSAGLLVEAVANAMTADLGLVNQMNTAVGAINNAISDLRQSLSEMEDVPVYEPLNVAMKRVVDESCFPYLVNIQMQVNLPETEVLSPIRTGNITAVLNESISNAVRHGQAKNIQIELDKYGDQATLTIRDDGKGIAAHPKYGYGLRDMHDRARLLGGDIFIEGRPGSGTCVCLHFPLEAE